MTYDDNAAVPPAGTRVVHETHGPATITGDTQFGHWRVRFDRPFPGDGGRPPVEEAWCYPHNLRPVP